MTSKVVAPKFALSIPPRELLPVAVVSTSPATAHGGPAFPRSAQRSDSDSTPFSTSDSDVAVRSSFGNASHANRFASSSSPSQVSNSNYPTSPHPATSTSHVAQSIASAFGFSAASTPPTGGSPVVMTMPRSPGASSHTASPQSAMTFPAVPIHHHHNGFGSGDGNAPQQQHQHQASAFTFQHASTPNSMNHPTTRLRREVCSPMSPSAHQQLQDGGGAMPIPRANSERFAIPQVFANRSNLKAASAPTQIHCPPSQSIPEMFDPFAQQNQQQQQQQQQQKQEQQEELLQRSHTHVVTGSQQQQQQQPQFTAAAQPHQMLWRQKAPRALFEATEVLPGLYLGAYLDAGSPSELEKRNIRRIVNVAKECDVSPGVLRESATIQVRKYAITDHSDEDIAAHFDDAVEFIHSGIAGGEGVLVHCRQGVSRSATIVLAYLMQYGASDFPRKPCALQKNCHSQQKKPTKNSRSATSSLPDSPTQKQPSSCYGNNNSLMDEAAAFADSKSPSMLLAHTSEGVHSPEQQQRVHQHGDEEDEDPFFAQPPLTFDHPDHQTVHSAGSDRPSEAQSLQSAGGASLESTVTQAHNVFAATVGHLQQQQQPLTSSSHLFTEAETQQLSKCLAEGLRNGYSGCTCVNGKKAQHHHADCTEDSTSAAAGGMCYAAAFDLLKTKRPHVSPNLGFVLALHELDRQRGIDVA